MTQCALVSTFFQSLQTDVGAAEHTVFDYAAIRFRCSFLSRSPTAGSVLVLHRAE